MPINRANQQVSPSPPVYFVATPARGRQGQMKEKLRNVFFFIFFELEMEGARQGDTGEGGGKPQGRTTFHVIETTGDTPSER